jgi:uncharacterized protein YukE
MGTAAAQGGGGSTGYQVDTQAMDAVAGSLGQVSGDLQKASAAYTAPVCYNSSVFGEFGVDQAWNTFDMDWAAELKVTQRAVDELQQNVTTTTANYRTAESAVTASLLAIKGAR